MEPASATGPPSPARGSAGMPPPPSPAGATYQAPPTPKHETPEPIDLKSTEKRRKQARVGKSAVRETLQQNTMLLMCQEQESPNSYINGVKREVESPKEEQKKDIIQEDIALSKVETTNIEEKVEKVTITIQETKSENVTEPIKQVQCLKIEENEVLPPVIKELTTVQPSTIVQQLEPCVKTVAENVKVKNMKRKPSITNNIKEEPSPKKAKIEKSSGSYKDLIKKSYTAVQINNGKKKLLSRNLVQKIPRIRVKKPQSKRKQSPVKEAEIKKLKSSKPLTVSNHNSKITVKDKDKTFVEADSIENKEPPQKKGKKLTQFTTTKCKKIAPVVLDNLLARNSVDRTIESVISENTRTSKNGANNSILRTLAEKSSSSGSAKVKSDVKKDAVVTGKKGSSTTAKSVIVKTKTTECKKAGVAKRKTKSKSADVLPQVVPRIPRRSLPLPKWSNGWEWKGEPFDGKVFLNSDEATVIRKCYPSMVHTEGDIIEPRDCVLLKAGQRKNDLPFVAKIAALWENPEDGEMMMSLLWYYRPEHTEQGRLPSDQPDEVFASRHKDSNSVACIEDKCYVLTFNEYCRYRKNMRRLEEGMDEIPPCIPSAELYPRLCRQPPTAIVTPPEMVFFCRRVYDFRQKRIVKNPS
ncbi:bromo adjacent y domain-containing 1 protein [Holotrichia oblita]|uniref:Bromo adjacent y domain-containing 1 protein n=1 Tax=Holotrichia oblita TaxID=644536 RepID=A0ACB9T7S5_HOLOL|nr:bromo adjacent y domain-containing 1 protein [Holotrichia oblita]